MLSRTEFAMNRRGMLGPKIAALLRSTMAFDRNQAEGPENERFGGGPATRFRPRAHRSACEQLLPAAHHPMRLILPAQPDS